MKITQGSEKNQFDNKYRFGFKSNNIKKCRWRIRDARRQ
jgi:hypothetical protein